MVTIALPELVDWFVAAVACWKLGAIPQPVSSRLPGAELAAIVELADPTVVLGVEPDALPGRDVPAARATCRTRRRRRAAARCHLAGVEGADLGRLHRPAQADRVGRPAALDPDVPSPLGHRRTDGCW